MHNVSAFPQTPKVITQQHNKSIQELEREAMKYEYLMERSMQKYFRDVKNNKEALGISIRASKEASKRWKKIAYLERLLKFPF